MKRILSVILTLSLLILCGCTGVKTDSGKIKIVTTIFPQYDFARNIAGENAEITMLLPFGSESHDYEPSLSDIAAIEGCDLFIYVGGETDKWVEGIIKDIKNPNFNAISLLSLVKTLPLEEVNGMEEAHGHEHTDDCCDIDEHIWTSPKNAINISKAIGDRLCEINAVNADIYKENLNIYLEKLNTLDKSLTDTVNSGNNKTLIFSERFPFRYLTHDYGLNYYAAFNGCSGDTEPSLSTISFLIDKAEEIKAPVIFYTEFSKENVADTICNATGAVKLQLHSCHNISASDFEKGEDYLSLMTKNIENIGKAIK